MKYLKYSNLVFAALAMAACSAISQPADDEMRFSDLERVLALGTMFDLNTETTSWEKDLLVRLYEVPLAGGDCFEGTHGVCKNKYYFTTSTIDAYPDINVSELGIEGDLVSFKWLEDDAVDFVKLSLVIQNFTSEAIAQNTALEAETQSITVELYADRMSVSTQ